MPYCQYNARAICNAGRVSRTIHHRRVKAGGHLNTNTGWEHNQVKISESLGQQLAAVGVSKTQRNDCHMPIQDLLWMQGLTELRLGAVTVVGNQ